MRQHTRPLVRFVRTPKGILLGVFFGLLAVSTVKLGIGSTVPRVVVAAAIAGGLDVALTYVRRRTWIVPDGAILTGMIVAFILRPQESWSVLALAVAIAIVSKQALRTRWSNVLNPAAFALVVAAIALHTGQNWWGALPDLGLIGTLILLATGVFIADRINKLPMILAFFAAYFTLFSLASTFDSATVAEAFRTPDLQAALFFAFFMLDDPPTSPVRHEDQVVFGIIVAAVAYFVFKQYGGVYFLPVGLLVGNVWESGRRLVVSRVRVRGIHVPEPIRNVRAISGVATAVVALLLLLATAAGGPPGNGQPARVADASVRPGATARPDATAPSSYPFLSDFNADLAGTYSQTRSGDTTALTVDATMSGDLTLKLHLELTTEGGGGQVRPTVTVNKAQLLDPRTSAVVCNGELTAFNSQEVRATCAGAGPYQGVSMVLNPIMNADSGSTVSGSISGTMARAQ
jgi:Na+-translocating ferredoxin:NAD+ oxidoreductase RnfD subunit